MSLYSVEIIKVGESAHEALVDDMLVLFNQKVPGDAEEFCFIHTHDELRGNLVAGNRLLINETEYPITAVGSAATQNLKNLGHITLRFDGKNVADFPGSVHLSGLQPSGLNVGSKITFS